ALRASSKTVWIVVLDEDGSLRRHHTVHIAEHAHAEERAAEVAATVIPTPAVEPIGGMEAAAMPVVAHASEADAATDPHAVATVAPPTDTAPAEANATSVEAIDDEADVDARHRSMSREEVIALIAECIATEQPAGIAIPHGRRQELSEALLAEALARLSG